jgi:hypothetical protein
MGSSKTKNVEGPKVVLEYAKADVAGGVEGPFLGTTDEHFNDHKKDLRLCGQS